MNEYERALLNTISRYPGLSSQSWGIVNRPNGGQGQLEFRHPEEPVNPYPGIPTIEVYNQNLKGSGLEKAIFGDMLHYVPEINPEFRRLQEDFVNKRSIRDYNMDLRAYQRDVKQRGEKRPYKKWWDLSRKDAWVRGLLAPDKDDNWANAYSPEQRKIGEQMLGLLK